VTVPDRLRKMIHKRFMCSSLVPTSAGVYLLQDTVRVPVPPMRRVSEPFWVQFPLQCPCCTTDVPCCMQAVMGTARVLRVLRGRCSCGLFMSTNIETVQVTSGLVALVYVLRASGLNFATPCAPCQARTSSPVSL
jgi:hypothetical protein